MNIWTNNDIEDVNDYKIQQDETKENKTIKIEKGGHIYTYTQKEVDDKENSKISLIASEIGLSSNYNQFNLNKNTNIANTITTVQNNDDNYLININNNDNNFIVNKSNSVLSLFNQEDNKECKVAEWDYLGSSFTIDKQVYRPTTSLAFITTPASYIYRVKDPAEGKIKILKIARPDEAHINAKSILNERRILKEVHGDKNAKGICPYPQLLFFKNTQEVAYLQEEYECSLANPDLLTIQNQTKGVLDLFDGLYHLHSKGIVHGDIKPNNCGSKGGKFYLSDFGTARKIEEDASFLNNPFGGYTRPYLSNGDISEGKKIYFLNLIAKIAQKKLDNIPLDLDDAKNLENYINTINSKDTYMFHHKTVKGKHIIQEIRLEIADILRNQNSEKIKEYQFLNYNTEIRKIKNNGNSLAKLQPNISLYDYHGTKTEQDSRHWELINVCKKRDIYALGKTLIFLFAPDLGKKDNEISDKQILNYLHKNKKQLFSNLSLENKDRLIKLLTNMISDKLNERPLIEVARNEYKNIMGL